MKDKVEPQKRKAYQKPAVTYAKKIEVVAAICNTARSPFGSCRKSGSCPRIID